MQILEALKKP
jgi:hypothetical protein